VQYGVELIHAVEVEASPGPGLVPERATQAEENLGRPTMNATCSAIEKYLGLKKVECLFCESIVSKKFAKRHNCPPKIAAEIRLGSKLATYDPVELLIQFEREFEATNLQHTQQQKSATRRASFAAAHTSRAST
jgi:hypothetical protein